MIIDKNDNWCIIDKWKDGRHYRAENGDYVRSHLDGGLNCYSGSGMDSLIEFSNNLRMNIGFYMLDLCKQGDKLIKWLFNNKFEFIQDFDKDTLIKGSKWAKMRLTLIADNYNKKPYWYKKDNSFEDYAKKHWTTPVLANEFSYIERNGEILSLKIGSKLEIKDCKAINSSIEREIKGDSIFDREISLNAEMGLFLSTLKKRKVDIKLTMAATAYKNWNELLWRKITHNNFTKRLKKTKDHGFKVYGYYLNGVPVSNKKYKAIMNRVMEDMFPSDTKTINDLTYWDKAVAGGINIANPKFTNKVLKGRHFDKNSSYLDVMASLRLFPIGKPLNKKPTGESVYLIHFEMKNEVHNNGGMPFFPKREYDKATQYLDVVPKGSTAFMTSPEFEQFIKQYNVKRSDYKVIKQQWFKAITGEQLGFIDYKDKWYPLKVKAKKENDINLEKASKGFIVSLYGDFLKKTRFIQKYYLGYKTIAKDESGYISYVKTLSATYNPIGIFISSYNRLSLIKTTEAIWKDHCYYCDTDSVFCDYVGAEYLKETVLIDDYELGAWKREVDDDGKYFFKGTKRYNTFKDGIYRTTISGIQWTKEKPFATFDEMKNGFTIYGQKHWVDGEIKTTSVKFQ